MKLTSLLFALASAVAVTFSLVVYVDLGILEAPTTNEIVIRSIIFFLPPMGSIPLAMAFRRRGEVAATRVASRDNPRIPCSYDGCPKGSFLYSEAAWILQKDPLNLNQRIQKGACPWCIKGDEIILGDNKVASQIEVGSKVIGREGLTLVTNTFNHDFVGEMVRIRATGALPLEVTAEHPMLIVTRGSSQNGEMSWKTTWMEASCLDVRRRKCGTFREVGRHFAVLPKLKGTIEMPDLDLTEFTTPHGLSTALGKGINLSKKLDEDFAWLMGMYTAEGNFTKNGSRFSLSLNEKEIHERIKVVAAKLGYATSRHYAKNESEVTVEIFSRILARALDSWCGHGAANKKIPEFILFNKDDRILKSFLEGYFEGDGAEGIRKNTGRRYYVATTVSKILALQLQLALARLGQMGTLCVASPENSGLIQGRMVRFRAAYRVYVQEGRTKRHFVETPTAFLLPIKTVEKFGFTGKVFNVETEDNAFLVSNLVTHNCQSPNALLPDLIIPLKRFERNLPVEVIKDVAGTA